MHHPTLRRIGLAAAALVLTAGCAANPLRRPAPTPTPGTPPPGAQAPGQASLTPAAPPTPGPATVTPADDPNTCRAVLGQPPVNTDAPEAALAHGVLMHDYALVALPAWERITMTPEGADQGTSRVTPPSPGTTPGTTPGDFGTGKPNGSAPALNRIRAACGVSRIKVVSEVADRARMQEIVISLRAGRSPADFRDELEQISQRAVSWTVGTPGNPATGEPAPGR